MMLARLLLIGILGLIAGCVGPPKRFEPIVPQRADESNRASQSTPTTITIDQNGQTIFEGRSFGKDEPLGELAGLLRAKAEVHESNGDEKLTVYLKAKKEVKYAYVERVINELKKIDGVRVGIQVVD